MGDHFKVLIYVFHIASQQAACEAIFMFVLRPRSFSGRVGVGLEAGLLMHDDDEWMIMGTHDEDDDHR